NRACKDLDLSKLDGNVITFEEFRNNCETLPIMSEKRVVLISDFKLLESIKTKGMGEEEEKLLIEYLKSLPKSSVLIITTFGVDKRKRLFKTISEYGGSYDFTELDEKSLKTFIVKKFKEAGKTVKPMVVEELINISGYYEKETDYTLYHLDNDIKKALAYNEGSEIKIEDIDATVSGNINTNIFALIDSLSRDRKDEALQLLHNLLVSGEKEYKLLALICSQFETILAVKELKEEGKPYSEIVKILGIHEFRVKKAAAFAELYSVPHLRKVLQKAYDVDKNMKTGLLESSIALEMFIAEI
ncbi:MAG: DNA polymerase III subunit delta, partial [bacterium]